MKKLNNLFEQMWANQQFQSRQESSPTLSKPNHHQQQHQQYNTISHNNNYNNNYNNYNRKLTLPVINEKPYFVTSESRSLKPKSKLNKKKSISSYRHLSDTVLSPEQQLLHDQLRLNLGSGRCKSRCRDREKQAIKKRRMPSSYSYMNTISKQCRNLPKKNTQQYHQQQQYQSKEGQTQATNETMNTLTTTIYTTATSNNNNKYAKMNPSTSKRIQPPTHHQKRDLSLNQILKDRHEFIEQYFADIGRKQNQRRNK